MLHKLGAGPPGSQTTFAHPHVFERQQTSGPERLCIGSLGGHVELMLDLAATWNAPCAVLYVLLVPRRQKRDPGRYQSPPPMPFDTVAAFFDRFRTFFEMDGRHHVWIATTRGETLVYDHHDWIYAYGDLAAYETILNRHGIRPGQIELPVPHSHHYHHQFDDMEDELMRHWDWTYSPLHPDDDR